MFASNTSQVSSDANWIEDVFSTYLYTGNSSTQTITNGIDLSTYGGLVWTKGRSAARTHVLSDTNRGIYYGVFSPSTQAQMYDVGQGVTAYNTNGFSIGYGSGSNIGYEINLSGVTYASWTFRKQPKFFDVVTYTGNDAANRQISHSLGSTPGCIIVKKTNEAGAWYVYHRSLGDWQANTPYTLYLNTTDSQTPTSAFKGNAPTSTTFTVDGVSGAINETGKTYVAYLFAHNAGGFGLTGTDNVISCGSYTGDSASAGKFVSLGFEPQWVLQKCISSAGTDWHVQDVMRGAPVPSASGKVLRPNSSIAEYDGTNAYPAATGFYATGDDNNSGDTYIYIAIRRGPMKTPTSGTSVFTPVATSVSTGTKVTTGFPVDLQLAAYRDFEVNKYALDRLRGVSTTEFETSQTRRLLTNTTGAEATGSDTRYWDNTGFQNSSVFASNNVVFWNFRRAPGFFDEVCYTGTVPLDSTTPQTVNHNLGVAPELIIFKSRSLNPNNWVVCYNINSSGYDRAFLNLDQSGGTFTGYTAYRSFLASQPTTTQLSLGSSGNTTSNVAYSGATYVAYLFASCPGVSKVGSYTGNGSSQTINCGFTGGARFVMIKRTDSTGDWYVWDTARGIVSANDPRLSLNTTAAEVTTDDSIDPDNSGFIVNQVSATNINVSSATYIYLAIA